jgi:hypothetical protein
VSRGPAARSPQSTSTLRLTDGCPTPSKSVPITSCPKH